MTNAFKIIFLIVIVILTIMSALALISVHLELFDSTKYSFDFSPSGIDLYLSTLGKYNSLFAAIVATIGVYFGLLRLKAATDSNSDRLMQDRFSEWRIVLEIRFIEIEKFDPFMKKGFIKVRFNFFRSLYGHQFAVMNKEDFTQLFNLHFKDLVPVFE